MPQGREIGEEGTFSEEGGRREEQCKGRTERGTTFEM